MCETLPADGPAAPVPRGADHAGRGSAGFPPVLSEGNPMVKKKRRRQASAHQKKARRGAGRSVPANPGRGVRTDSHPLAIVGIGASAGGLEAFTRLLKALSPDTGMAFVLVQHLDPKHESLLPEFLSKTTSKALAEGGITFAQDAESAKYGSMPHSALAAGVVDFVLPPESIAKELARIGRHPFVHAAPAAVVEEGPPEQEDILHRIFAELRGATNV